MLTSDMIGQDFLTIAPSPSQDEGQKRHSMDRLKAIESFVRIAQTGSLSKAAQDLGTSRALISSHLKQLEDHLGVRLIN
ncbi:MAG: hypothetical protein RIQ68_494, partial [Pseudomonadota bacterium]